MEVDAWTKLHGGGVVVVVDVRLRDEDEGRERETKKVESSVSIFPSSLFKPKADGGRVVGKEVGNREGVCRIYRIYTAEFALLAKRWELDRASL